MGINYLPGTSVSALGDDWNPPALGAWLQQPDPAPRWLLKDLLPADSIILMSGKAKLSKKTWMAFALALAVATGVSYGPFVPVNVAGEPVLVIEAEGSSPFTKDRWRMLGAGLSLDVTQSQNIYFSHRAPILLNDPKWIVQIKAFVRDRGIKLVLVDPLAAHMKGNENDVESVQEIIRSLISIRETGASVLLLHHLAKPIKDFTRDIDDDLRGSSAIPGAYDQHWALRQRSIGRATDLIVRFKDGADEKRFEVEWFIGQGKAEVQILPCDGEDYLDRKRAELLQILASGEEATEARVREMLGMDDVNDLLDSMLNDGLLVKHGRNWASA